MCFVARVVHGTWQLNTGQKFVYEGLARYLGYYLVQFVAFKVPAVSHTVFTFEQIAFD